jgi:hypothetical protein
MEHRSIHPGFPLVVEPVANYPRRAASVKVFLRTRKKDILRTRKIKTTLLGCTHLRMWGVLRRQR